MKSKRPTLSETLASLEKDPGKFLVDAFKSNDVRASELRERTGLPASTCRAFLNGSRPNPTMTQFRLLLTAALDVLKVNRC